MGAMHGIAGTDTDWSDVAGGRKARPYRFWSALQILNKSFATSLHPLRKVCSMKAVHEERTPKQSRG